MQATMRAFASGIALLAAVVLTGPPLDAAEVTVAVAANFTGAMKTIAAGFEETTRHRVLLSSGSTGKLYAQIRHGAPFHVFLAADQKHTDLLVRDGLGSERFTYAQGRLVLWSAEPDRVDAAGTVLRLGDFARLAIANPRTAPYGVAAMEVLNSLGLSARLAPRLVKGESAAQAYQFVATGNADLGMVAGSDVAKNPAGSRWEIPQELYSPIRQDAVLLERGSANPAARALIEYLKGPDAAAVMEEFGYRLP